MGSIVTDTLKEFNQVSHLYYLKKKNSLLPFNCFEDKKPTEYKYKSRDNPQMLVLNIHLISGLKLRSRSSF